MKRRFKRAVSLALTAAILTAPAFAEEKKETKYGSAHVDQRRYPLTEPFIHPPFYNARVKVVLKNGVIESVSDDNTATKGWDPATSQQFWDSKNKPYWDMALKAKVFDKFKGKTKEQVAAMKMDTKEADVISGATETGMAIQEAVLNAIDGKAGKKFLAAKQTLHGAKLGEGGIVEETKEGYTVTFQNSLPGDFKIKLHSVASTIYNGKNILDPKNYEVDIQPKSLTLKLKGKEFKAGKYFVNIVDENNIWRSPDFESGHGTPLHHPFFEIGKGASLSFKDGKLSVSDKDLANVLLNIEHILVTELDAKGKPVMVEVKDKDGKVSQKENTSEIEPVGHHGTVSAAYQKKPFFKANGSIDETFQVGRRDPRNVFEAKKSYQITVEAFGYKPLSFTYKPVNPPAPVKKEEVKKDEAQKPASAAAVTKTGEAKTEEYDYTVKIKLTIENGKIKNIEDNNTETDGNDRWWNSVKNKAFSKYIGKTKEEVEKMNVDKGGADVVSGATFSSQALKQAVLKAFNN